MFLTDLVVGMHIKVLSNWSVFFVQPSIIGMRGGDMSDVSWICLRRLCICPIPPCGESMWNVFMVPLGGWFCFKSFGELKSGHWEVV